MADSERPQDRDEEVPDPPDRDNGPGDADRDVAGHGRQEPDRGSSWKAWIRLTAEVILPHVSDIIAFINGSGG
jgi:hypothetical protein